MKKLMLVIVGFMISTTLFSQSCLDDVWMCLRQNQAPKAKKLLESCMASNPDNAQVWLMKANVYVNLYNMDQKKISSDPSYTPRYPDALLTANEAFIKALELDPKVEPKTGMLGAIAGQKLCAEPFYNMGVQAEEKGDYQNAVKFFTLSAKNYELANVKNNAAAAYLQLALAYGKLNDQANYKNMLLKSIACSPAAYPACYTELYYIYQAENDTVNCGKILEKGFAAIPVEKQGDMIEAQMNYYSMTGQKDKLMALCDTMLKNNPGDMTTIINCANYLSNFKAYEKAEEILNEALAKNPNEFKLNSQMAYRYFMEVVDYEDRIEAAKNAKQWSEMNPLREAQKPVLQKAHDWSDKAYQINPDDRQNNIMLQQLKVKLLIPVPDELKAKVDSYRHKE
ncbi:MAG: hypothetical protein IJQ94_01195 [Bacteroidales bacterium]|nr:hypothetical protein [Bacteroidales bacterium]MBR0304243.1 hypothetical protein [Bacteroidales bacterium]